MTSTVLQFGSIIPALADALRAEYRLLRLPDDATGAAEFLAEHGEEVQVIVTAGVAGTGNVDAALINALPKLALIAHCTVGYDRTDLRAAAARGIVVSNTPDVLNDCVADTAVGLMIDTMRRTCAADRYVREGRWTAADPFPLTRRVSGAPVGILGMGRIGGAIAERLVGFGCPISYHNRDPVPDSPHTYVGSPVELAESVDVLIIATPGGAGTKNLVDAAVIAALGPRGYLVNIARGSVVDQDALVAALRSGELAGAGLDVFVNEPHVPEELRALDNVVLLPHVASATEETRQAMADLTFRNVQSFLSTGRLITPVALPQP